MERFHLLNGPGAGKRKPVDVAAGAADARRLATEGAVLLKNEASALPLTAGDLKSVVLIGPTAGQVAAGFMGERGYGFESRLVSPLDALKRMTGASVAYSIAVDLTGEPVPPSALSHNGEPGLIRRSADGELPSEQIDLSMDFAGPRALPALSDFAWTGTLVAPEDGEYTLMLQPVLGGGSEGGGSITIDDAPVARTGGPGFGGSGVRAKKWSSLLPTTDGRDNGRGTVRLSAGPHRIEVSINSTGEGPLTIRLAWTTPSMRSKAIEQAIAAARAAGAAVIFAWAPTGTSILLPESQDELIEEIAAVSRKTIVVLNTGGPVLMPWRDKVHAILEMWYPGQEGGWATADLLTGREAPRGKLPITFPARLEDAPARAAGHPERIDPPSEPGRTGMNPDAQPVVFSEGIFVGYRWYDQQGIDPLFPFGHGLSYSQFEYSGLAVARVRDGLRVSFTLRNAGSKPAYETPQVYVGPATGAGVAMPPRSLVAFRRVRLAPGESVKVKLTVAGRQLSYWSTDLHDWKEISEGRTVYVGSSSRNCPLSGSAVPR
jgi:beta-glucosidase